MTAKYLPFDGRAFRHRIGARPLQMTDWLDSEGTESEMANKAEMLSHRHEEVFASLDNRAVDEGSEVLRFVVRHLDQYHPGLAADPPDSDPLHPLDRAGRLIAEDLCIMGDRDGVLVLTAASLCSPNRWKLADKLGRTMFQIHAPVPRYQMQIGEATDKLLLRLAVDRPIWRLNWGLLNDPTLFQPDGHGNAGGVDVADSELFLRVERQALIRLPETNAILFSIRTYISALPEAVSSHADRARLVEALQNLPDDVLDYKSMSSFVASVRL